MSETWEESVARSPQKIDPNQPLPFELHPKKRGHFLQIGGAVVLFGVGVIVGFVLAPETPKDTVERVVALQTELSTARAQIVELERTLAYQKATAKSETSISGKLKPEDRERHDRHAKQYSKLLRQIKAQPAAELMQWFVGRWNSLLDRPEHNDRTGRRAELLSQLIGGMAANINPNDYVPWQAEFLAANWLGDLHFDMDGDGFPGLRSMPNPRDGFADKSVCHIAMALNQAVRDARILVMSDMQCDRPWAKMSVFLQGTTMDDALTNFVLALRQEGFIAVERNDGPLRLILIGQGTRGQRPQ